MTDNNNHIFAHVLVSHPEAKQHILNLVSLVEPLKETKKVNNELDCIYKYFMTIVYHDTEKVINQSSNAVDEDEFKKIHSSIYSLVYELVENKKADIENTLVSALRRSGTQLNDIIELIPKVSFFPQLQESLRLVFKHHQQASSDKFLPKICVYNDQFIRDYEDEGCTQRIEIFIINNVEPLQEKFATVARDEIKKRARKEETRFLAMFEQTFTGEHNKWLRRCASVFVDRARILALPKNNNSRQLGHITT